LNYDLEISKRTIATYNEFGTHAVVDSFSYRLSINVVQNYQLSALELSWNTIAIWNVDFL